MKYSTVVFDFDGTIADTQQTMFAVANLLADEFGFAPIRADEMPTLKRMSARELLVERLHIPLWNVVKIYRLEKKGRALFVQRTSDIQVFSGMKEAISMLRASGCRVGIVTSNTHEVVSKVLEHANIAVDFVHAGSAILGKDRAIAHALTAQNIDPGSVVYVGDELRDVEACKKAGIAMLGVSWGYNDPAALRGAGIKVVSSAEEMQKNVLEASV